MASELTFSIIKPDAVRKNNIGEILTRFESAGNLNRELMGATNPQEAIEGTIRRDFAESIDANAVHGSDSPASAKREIEFFFQTQEISGS